MCIMMSDIPPYSSTVKTLFTDGSWCIRSAITPFKYTETWVAHTGCRRMPMKVKQGKCHVCGEAAPDEILGFTDMILWER